MDVCGKLQTRTRLQEQRQLIRKRDEDGHYKVLSQCH